MKAFCDMCPDGSADRLAARRGRGVCVIECITDGGICCRQTMQAGIRVDFLDLLGFLFSCGILSS